MSTAIETGLAAPTWSVRRFLKQIPGALALWRRAKGLPFRGRHGFWPPPPGTDLSTASLLDELSRLECFRRPGEVVEIGAFLGGGTYVLSNFLARRAPHKRLYTIDLFDPGFDLTPCTRGLSMSSLYANMLDGRSQEEIFAVVTTGCRNLTVIKGDSRQVKLPCSNICFAYIDGNHEFSHVKSDFALVWQKLVSGGVVAFDDYGFDIGEVTLAIHELIGEYASQISRFHTNGKKTIFIQKA
jgi:hypothetical protein